jgi:hypothetical protein
MEMMFLNKPNADIEHYFVFNLDCFVLHERNTKIDDATGVIRIRKSKIKDKQNKRINKDPQNTTQKTGKTNPIKNLR